MSTADFQLSKNPPKLWLKPFSYIASITAIIAAALLMGNDFQRGVLQTYAIQNDLAQYQLSIQQSEQPGDHLTKALPLLNELKSATLHRNNNFSFLTHLLSFYSDKSQKTAQSVYQQALQTIIFPAIKNCFENYLKLPAAKNPTQTYAVLKAYLMLSDVKNLQANYIADTLKQLMPTTFTPAALHELVAHIKMASSQAANPVNINNQLIATVREQLTKLPSVDLAFIILKNKNNNDSMTTLTLKTNHSNPTIFFNSAQSAQVFSLYTSHALSNNLLKEVNAAATEALQGNEVLGTAEILSNEATINNLAQQLRTRYITNYVGIWESIIASLKLANPTTLQQTDDIISNLTGNSSPLLQLLQTIKQNTAFAPITTVSPKIQVLNNLLTNARSTEENTLYQLFVSLRQLHFYLQTILGTNDIGAAAFDAAKKRMQKSSQDPINQIHLLANQTPEPLKTWLNNLANQSWFFILQETSRKIESAWQLDIIPLYHSQFANNFPINPNATEEIDIQQFASFISKQGTLASFYRNYLEPFISEDGKQWRVVDNQKIFLSSTALTQLQEANKLQNVSKYKLFTQAHNNPAMQRFRLPEKLLS